MKKIPLKKWIIGFTFILCGNTAFPQCPQPPQEWEKKILTIEENTTVSLDNRINQLEHLLSLYGKCVIVKDSIYARIVHRLGAYYHDNGELEKGIDYTKMAIEINKRKLPSSQESFLAHSYFNLGYFYNLQNFFEISNQYLDSCIDITAKYPQKRRTGIRAYEKKSFSFFATGEYARSVEIADYGFIQNDAIMGTELEAMLLVQKAQSQLPLNLLSEAEDNILRTIEIFSTPGIPSHNLASSYSVYANFLKLKEDYNQSIHYYKEAYKLNFGNGNILQCLRDLSDLGTLYHENLNEPKKALEYFNLSVDLNLKLETEDLYQLALVYNNMGEVYMEQNNYQKALHYFQQGLIVLPIGFKDTSLHINPDHSMFKMVTNDHIVATLLANKGRSFSGIYKQEPNREILLHALHSFKAADKIIDQMRWRQNSFQSKLFWREKTRSIYENAIETCLLLQDTDNGYFFLEKSRAALLSDKLKELEAQKSLSEADLLKEQGFRYRIFSLQNQLAQSVEDTAAFKKIKQELFASQTTFERFIKTLESKYPAYYKYKYDTVSFSINEIRDNILKDDSSLIEYFNGDSVIYVLAIKPDTSMFKRISYKNYRNSSHELLKLTSDKLLLNQNYSRYQHVANELYEWLFKPLSIDTRKVIISPDDQLIPFETLLTDIDNPSSFLLRDHAFSYTYSADYLMGNIDDQFDASNSILGVAPVDYHPSLQLQSLEGSDLSLQNIGANLPYSKLLTNENASKKQFLDNLPLYSIVHLYSHADADSIGSEPVIYLQDSVLGVSELQTLGDLSTRLIVLSACKTGIGKNIRGEGIFSLARGFAAAGITSSVTTLWQIDNEPTYQLTELFFEYVSQQLPLDEALQKAKLDFLDNNDITYELPFYWAANILIGKTDKFNREGNESTYFPYVFFFAFLLIAFIFFYYKRLMVKRQF